MELKEFVSNTINSIIDAIEDVKKNSQGSDSIVCPPLGLAIQNKLGINLDAQGRYHQNIEFDIAITASTENKISGTAKAKAGVMVVNCSADVDTNHQINSATVSRVKFSVPIGIQCTKTIE